ncbi:MAG TPA: GMC family oxidoreductase [Chitinophagaceae bacterium]|nr:GMC family oxidoreductase [Chitinophagaceae bacterium]
MHIDARELNDHSTIEGDVCIIGAGAAGISMSLDWMNSPYKIILLEGGGFEYDEKVQELYDGKTTGQRYYPLQSARLHYFGGTTGHWAGFCSTFDSIDFKKRDWVPHSGWPIRRTDLDPFYRRAHEILDLGPYEYDVAFWQKQDPSMISLPVDENVIWNKIWHFSPPTRFGQKYRDAIVRAKNIHLYTYANVTNITVKENASAVKEVTIKNYAGKTHTVKARFFVLACCSIQNARILLASNTQMTPGLGNQNDLVGRFFMEHLEVKSGELRLEKPFPMKLYNFDFGVTKTRAELAISEQQQTQHKILNGTMSLTPMPIANRIVPVIDIWNNKDPRKSADNLLNDFSSAGKEYDPSKDDHGIYELFTRIEQAPNPNSRITLDREVDALGMPKSILHWELTPFEKRSIRKIHELLGQEIGKSGIGRVKMMDYLKDENDFSWPDFTGGGWHHMGTTRMSDDPKQGVVNANCQVHGIRNLYVAGASCNATAAAPNPTLTVVALTLRLSDHVKERMKIRTRLLSR